MSPHSLCNLVLYTSTVCPYAQRARIALTEVYGHGGHKEIEIDFDEKPAWYLEQVNPKGQVPALKVGDEIFTESLRIVELITDCSEGTRDPLMPSDPLMRARVRRFVDRFASLVIVHLNPIYTREEYFRIPTLLEGISAVQDYLPKSGPFFLEDHFSVADIAVAPFIGRMYVLAKAGLIPDVFSTVSEDMAYKRFNDYAQALFARPSFQSTFLDEATLVNRASQRLCVG